MHVGVAALANTETDLAATSGAATTTGVATATTIEATPTSTTTTTAAAAAAASVAAAAPSNVTASVATEPPTHSEASTPVIAAVGTGSNDINDSNTSTNTNLWGRLSDGLSFLMTKALHNIKTLDAAQELTRFARFHRPDFLNPAASANQQQISALIPNSQIVFLAHRYPSLAHPHFLDDFHSRLWITYRKGFAAIKPSSYTSDSGWGCMLRSGQMLIANAFVFHELGRDWRLGDTSDKEAWLSYCNIISKFMDVNTSPFSIQRISTLGVQFDKQVGEWFGPSTISQVLRVLVNNEHRTSMRVHVANDGVLYKSEVISLLSNTREDGKTMAVLVLIPLRLGVENMNPVYYPAVKHCFNMTRCVGIAGGRPNSSLFFLGVDGDHLIYLDPHYMRPCVEPRDISSYKMEDLLSYHCETVRLLPIASMDPSLVVGFYCSHLADFESMCTEISELATGLIPLFSIESTPPDFDIDVDVLSEYDF
ncbi:hypothetical protein BASA50_004397 [Batrachochytrium salamandrivorans]|uniref:Cysteine protease n=1 Tax=Batrachochytrium salamandrivorans TaxID=1357716 RepID=A0ABQ8FFN2_9FUNG|nr:hypothetical protein BASA62_004055 [Batrachochytrium salamandrivorans]KAH6585331.1 hypothetical protein BASA60_000620 [Batrachochytrium salamandrivorans]KAH6597480.1 hypothetical protein BASA50_004397 [Batrachochytrium salamandrivorans]